MIRNAECGVMNDESRRCAPASSIHHSSFIILHFLLALLVCAGSAAAQNYMWLSANPDDGGLYTTKNPAPNVAVGHSVELYVWMTKATTSKGYDGISLDVQVKSANGGRVGARIDIDNPGGRWFATYGGGPLSGTGGTGIDNANAVDLTNTDTVSSDPFRFAKLTITAEHEGTVSVFLGIGNKGIADNGSAAALYIGMNTDSTFPEPMLVAGSNYGAITNVPEATINVLTGVIGDFDADSDVDLTDFARFQACFNGPNRPPAQGGCDAADADLDSDVDLADFALFQTCFNGPNRPPACLGG
jgi:hypothetical protein